MAFLERLEQTTRTLYTYELEPGVLLHLRPVPAYSVIPRLGVRPQTIEAFLTMRDELDPKRPDAEQVAAEALRKAGLDVLQLAELNAKLNAAYLVYGITAVEEAGEVKPLRLRFDDAEGGGVPVTAFRRAIIDAYGEDTLRALERRLHEISGEIRPEEVAQTRDNFPGLDAGAARDSEGLRDGPGEPTEAAAG